MSDTASPNKTNDRGRETNFNWPLIRKFETLVFMSMLLAVPFFAFRIVAYTATSLAVSNTAVDLVNDLIRAKDISKDSGLNITVTSKPADASRPAAYLLENGTNVIEQVDLPKGVTIVGAVSFDERGMPSQPASFIITKAFKSTTVEVDGQGTVSTH